MRGQEKTENPALLSFRCKPESRMGLELDPGFRRGDAYVVTYRNTRTITHASG